MLGVKPTGGRSSPKPPCFSARSARATSPACRSISTAAGWKGCGSDRAIGLTLS